MAYRSEWQANRDMAIGIRAPQPRRRPRSLRDSRDRRRPRMDLEDVFINVIATLVVIGVGVMFGASIFYWATM